MGKITANAPGICCVESYTEGMWEHLLRKKKLFIVKRANNIQSSAV